MVVHEDDVGDCARDQLTNRVFGEEEVRQFRVVFHRRLFNPQAIGTAGITGGDLVQQISGFPFRPHIVAETVIAEADAHPALHHFIEGHDADAVVHVGARLVRHPVVVLKQRQFVIVDVDAVCGDSLSAFQHAAIMQALNDALTVFAQTFLLINFMFGNVNVKSGVGRLGGNALFQGRVTQRQAGVQPKRATHARVIAIAVDETHVFGNSGFRFVEAVTITDFIAEDGAKPGFLHRPRDHVEAAVDKVGAGVMVEQRGCSVFDGIYQRN